MRVARTIADLRGHGHVTDDDILSAGSLRDPTAGADDRLAA
jgi:hypothetical protein